MEQRPGHPDQCQTIETGWILKTETLIYTDIGFGMNIIFWPITNDESEKHLISLQSLRSETNRGLSQTRFPLQRVVWSPNYKL